MLQDHLTDNILVNIGLSYGSVPSGNKALPQPMLTQIYVTIRHQ